MASVRLRCTVQAGAARSSWTPSRHAAGSEGRRLIGCHVGRSFDVPENGMCSRFTGRHWWGFANSEDGIVDPITGLDAKDLATGIGLPERSGTKSGTSIMIVDFDTSGEELAVIGSRVIEGLLWNFWPRMMRDTPVNQRFSCRVEVDGSPLTIPFPEDFPPLDLFSKAMRAVRSGSGNDISTYLFAKTSETARNPGAGTGHADTPTPARRRRLPLPDCRSSHCAHADPSSWW